MKQILTANNLFSGEVIYLKLKKKWVDSPDKASVFDNQEEADKALAFANLQIGELVDAYLIDVELTPAGKLKPKTYREQLRSIGPTNYFHGKQAEKDKDDVRV